MSRGIRLSYLLLLSTSVLLAWLGVQKMADTPWGSVSGMLLVGIAMLIFAWVVTKAPHLMNMDENSIESKIGWRLDWLIQALLDRPMLYGGILAGGCAILAAPYPSFQPWPVLVLWLVGLTLFLMGVADLRLTRVTGGFVTRVLAWVRAAPWDLLAVLSLTLLALLLRSIALDAIPHNVHGDEGEMGMTARAVLSGELRDPFVTAWLGHSTLWFFMQALALRLFGDDIGGLRMLSAIFGTLAVPALYVFARPLYGRAVGIIAAALLAAYHFHVHYSRIALNNIADPLMMVLTLAAFFYGYRRRSPLGFALAGIATGIAQYFYFSARFIPVLVLAVLLYLAVMDRRQLFQLGRPLGIMALSFILAIGPLARFFITRPDTFVGRVAEHGLLQNGHLTNIQANGQNLAAALGEHAYKSFGLLITVDDHTPFYDPGVPLLDYGMVVLFILSVVLVFLNWRKIEVILLLLWVGGTALFGGFLLWDAPQSTRYIIAAPALCILVALALTRIGSLLGQITALPRLCIGAITAVVLGIMAWNIYFYFDIYTPRNNYAQTYAVTDLADYLHPQAGQRYVYMFTHPYFYLHHGTIEFVGEQPDGMDVNDHLTSGTDLPDPPTGLRPLFIFVPQRLDELAIVKQRYPSGQLQEYRIQPSGERTIMYIYEPRS